MVPQRYVALGTITNTSPWPATDVEFVVALPNGDDQVIHIERIESSRTTRSQAPEKMELPIAEKSLGWLPHEVRLDLGDVIREPGGRDQLTLRFSDERGLMRWEVKNTWKRGPDGGSWPTLTQQRRIK